MNIVGVDDAEGPPVPISNTVVKLGSAENTWLATAWEDRKTPTFFMQFFIILLLTFYFSDFIMYLLVFLNLG